MKKALILLLCLVMVVSLAACKSEEAQRVDKMIDDIGEVTLDSNKAIYRAENEVEALSQEDRDQLENVDKLKAMHEEYDYLKLKTKAEKVEKLIGEIKEEITLSSGNAIDKAREAYEKLTTKEKELVENYDVLKKAQEKLEELRITHTEELINEIGEVSLDSSCKYRIERAEEAYNKLSITGQGKVSNIDTLTEARQTYDHLEFEHDMHENYQYMKQLQKDNPGIYYGNGVPYGN